MSEWKPIETAPHHQDVLVYREDAGVFMGHYGHVADWLIDGESKEAEQYDEETLFKEDWWAIDEKGMSRLEGDEAPTHWREIPPGPVKTSTIHHGANKRFCADNDYSGLPK